MYTVVLIAPNRELACSHTVTRLVSDDHNTRTDDHCWKVSMKTVYPVGS